MEILIKIVQALLSLAILVFIHELGHFIFAKIFKIRVSKFYLFFDVKFALLRFKPKNSETEYGIGWLPLGGYCKIDGMVDESLAFEGLKSEPKPWEFRSKPTWQRLLVMLGGILFNIILAILIYGAIVFTWGSSRLPIRNVGDNMVYSTVGHQMGLEDGDIPIAIDGKEIYYLEGSMIQKIANGDVLTVLRGDQEIDLPIPSDFMRALLASKSAFFMLDLPARIDTVLMDGEAKKAGLMAGDVILAIDEQPMDKLSKVIPTIKESRGDSLILAVQRGSEIEYIRSKVDEEKGLGIIFISPNEVFEWEQRSYGFFEAIPAGINQAYRQFVNYADQLKYVATPEGASNLGGLGTIGSLFPSRFDWFSFWNMTAFLSIIFSVMNLLPIPGLDGGHIMFILYEMISGRSPSLKWQMRFQLIGMLLLIILMLYANINDIFRFLL